MAELNNEQVVEMIKEKIDEKNEVIKEQQLQIQDLENQILELQERLEGHQKAADERDALVESISEALE